MKSFLLDFVSLFYPECCHACSTPLNKGEKILCTYCHYKLPLTNFHKQASNQVSRLFWGRQPIEAATACYTFQKGGAIQHLIFQFKYKGYPEIGIEIGRRYGIELRQAPLFRNLDLILPVPLHFRKQKIRGFNQSACFGEGLSQSLGIPQNKTCLQRIQPTESQTRKSRFSRWKNVETVFTLSQPEEIAGKHILLVDDVVTTGATLEACAKLLLEVEGTKVSIVAIAASIS